MLGSSSRVPLVRCPKCGHLLPELPPYSVYCCGGCGAYLRAEKGSSIVDDVLSENSCERAGGSEILGIDRDRVDEMPATSARISKSVRSRYGDAIRTCGDSDARSKSSGRSTDGVVRKPLDGHGESPARSVRQGVRKSPMIGEFDEHRSMGSEFVADYEEMESREKVGAWFEHVKASDSGYANRMVTQKGPVNEWLHYEEASVDESPNCFGSIPMIGERVGRRRADQIIDEIEPEYDDSYDRRRRMEVPHDDWVHRDLRVQDGYVGSVRGGCSKASSTVRQRFPVYPNEGPSNYPSYYGYDQPRHYQESYVGSSSSLQNVEMNRAELFCLYNDLKEQLSMTGDLPENSTRRGHHRISSADCYVGPDDYVHDEPLRFRRPAASIDLDERARMRPHYVNRSRVPVPPSRFVPQVFPFDDDPSWPQIPTPHHPRHFHPQRPAREYIPGHHVDSTYDPSGLNHRRYTNCQHNAASDFPDPHVQHPSGPRLPYSTPHGLSSHSRSSVESKSDGGGSAKEHNKRVVLVSKNQLVCKPIVGAAPFVICHNCSQLLRLPKKLITLKKTQLALQCGSCRATLSFDFVKKKPHASTQLHPKPNSTDVYDDPSKTSESDHKSTHHSSVDITNRESYDFDANGYTFPSTDSEPSMQLEDRRLISFEAQKQQGFYPSSSNASKGDFDLDNAISKADASRPLLNNIPPRPPPGSSLQEHLDYSANFSTMNFDKIETDVPGHDKGIINTDNSSLKYQQNIDGLAPLEINSNKVPKLDMSHSLGEATSNNDKGGNKKDASSFDGISERGFGCKELSPPHDALDTKADVIVNGQPLAHRVVRKAEKVAGPISPGNYWYDSSAGFWGIVGNCCLGIIPPFIEEFGFPMPVGCAGADTGIYVNGRELHEKDLELLSSRGFPRTRNKSYVVDIYGKVEDEETGDVVASLGKLAPTVEKTRRGFGMQPPEMQED